MIKNTYLRQITIILWTLAITSTEYAAAAAAAKSLQSCPTLCNPRDGSPPDTTLCDPRDGSPPGSPVPGILPARTLEWVAISFSNAGKWKVKVKSLSHIWPLATPWTAAYQAPLSMGFSRQEYWSGVPLHYWAYIWRKPQFKRHMYLSVHCSAIYCSQDMEVT